MAAALPSLPADGRRGWTCADGSTRTITSTQLTYAHPVLVGRRRGALDPVPSSPAPVAARAGNPAAAATCGESAETRRGAEQAADSAAGASRWKPKRRVRDSAWIRNRGVREDEGRAEPRQHSPGKVRARGERAGAGGGAPRHGPRDLSVALQTITDCRLPVALRRGPSSVRVKSFSCPCRRGMEGATETETELLEEEEDVTEDEEGLAGEEEEEEEGHEGYEDEGHDRDDGGGGSEATLSQDTEDDADAKIGGDVSSRPDGGSVDYGDFLQQQYNELVAKLQSYKESHGDCNVPRDWAENPKLGAWVHEQRERHRKGNLPKDRQGIGLSYFTSSCPLAFSEHQGSLVQV